MRVRMLTLAAGPSGIYQRGAELVVSDAEGMDMVKQGYAVPVPDTREVAAMEQPETRQVAPRTRRARKEKEV